MSWIRETATRLNCLLMVSLIVLGTFAGLASSSQPSGVINVTLQGTGEGYVVLDADANITFAQATGQGQGAKQRLELIIDTYAHEDLMTIDTTAKLSLPITIPPTPQGEIHFGSTGTKGIKSLIVEGEGSFSTSKSIATFTVELNGTITLMNDKNVGFKGSLSGKGDENRTFIIADAQVDFEEGSLDENTLAQLRFMSVFLTAESVNNLLRQGNITWIQVQKLKINFIENDMGGTLELHAEVLITKPPQETFTNTSLDVTRVQELIKELYNAVNVTTTSHFTLNYVVEDSDNAVISADLITHTEIEGNITKATEQLHTVIAEATDCAENTVICELVLLPSNSTTTIKLVSNDNKASIRALFTGLKIGHSELEGAEAEERVAEIIVSSLYALKDILPETIELNINLVNINNVTIDLSIMDSAKSLISDAKSKMSPILTMFGQEYPQTTTTSISTTSTTTTTTTTTETQTTQTSATTATTTTSSSEGLQTSITSTTSAEATVSTNMYYVILAGAVILAVLVVIVIILNRGKFFS